MEQVAESYDYVFVDTAPMQVSNDAAIFAKDGPSLLLVAGLGATRRNYSARLSASWILWISTRSDGNELH